MFDSDDSSPAVRDSRPSHLAGGTWPPALDWGPWLGWGVVVALLVILRLPVLYAQPGGLDDECYAVPGWTILQTGIPQLPHVAARQPESVYFHADQALYCEPPLMFYLQAGAYLVLPVEYGTGRLLSLLAGIGLLGAVWKITRQLTGHVSAAFWATLLCSSSRWFYFTILRVRPDMLCAMFGLLAALVLLRQQAPLRRRSLILLGVLIGLGGLSHAFALVYALQIAVILAVINRGRQRLLQPAWVALVSLIVMLAWLPLIRLHPDLFLIQFQNQYFTGHDTPLWQRLLLPGPSVMYHAQYLFENFGGIQFPLVLGSLFLTSFAALFSDNALLRKVCLLGWSGFYLMACLIGPHHMTLGYWIYPAAWAFVCLGWLLAKLADALTRRMPQFRQARWTVGLPVLLCLLPGGGLRATVSAVRNWDDPDFRAPLFARRLMQALPVEARYAVDPAFTLDFLVAGRKTLPAQVEHGYLPMTPRDYDFLIVSRLGLEDGMAQRQCAEKLWSSGIPENPLACFAEVFAAGKEPCLPLDKPHLTGEELTEPQPGSL